MKRLLALALAVLVLFSLPLRLVSAEGEPEAEVPMAEEPAAPEASAPAPEEPAAPEVNVPAAEEPAIPEVDAPAAEEPAIPEPVYLPAAPEPGVDLASSQGPTPEETPVLLQEPVCMVEMKAAAPLLSVQETASMDAVKTTDERPHDQPRLTKSLEYWEEERKNYPLTGDIREDVLIIARSQLGYSADSTCYVEDEAGRKLLYTRYGEWDGAKFSEWCDMFVSFCVYYAGNEDYPKDSSCARHELQLKSAGYWREWNSYIPRKGDLVFFAVNTKKSMPNHVGLIEEVIPPQGGQPGRLITIEGNQANPYGTTPCVRRMVRYLDSVVGYGTYERGKVYPETYTVRSDGYQIIDADSLYFVERPTEEALRFMSLMDSPYGIWWFPQATKAEPYLAEGSEKYPKREPKAEPQTPKQLPLPVKGRRIGQLNNEK